MTTALITGANRGLGRHFAAELLARGATVYAAAREPAAIDLPGVRPLALDITDPEAVAAAAAVAGDVPSLALGDKVTHDAYGVGTVVGVEGAGANSVAKIDFGSDGTKRLLLRYSPVTKL